MGGTCERCGKESEYIYKTGICIVCHLDDLATRMSEVP